MRERKGTAPEPSGAHQEAVCAHGGGSAASQANEREDPHGDDVQRGGRVRDHASGPLYGSRPSLSPGIF